MGLREAVFVKTPWIPYQPSLHHRNWNEQNKWGNCFLAPDKSTDLWFLREGKHSRRRYLCLSWLLTWSAFQSETEGGGTQADPSGLIELSRVWSLGCWSGWNLLCRHWRGELWWGKTPEVSVGMSCGVLGEAWAWRVQRKTWWSLLESSC